MLPRSRYPRSMPPVIGAGKVNGTRPRRCSRSRIVGPSSLYCERLVEYCQVVRIEIGPIVQLARRRHDLNERCLRRHLAGLVGAGIVRLRSKASLRAVLANLQGLGSAVGDARLEIGLTDPVTVGTVHHVALIRVGGDGERHCRGQAQAYDLDAVADGARSLSRSNLRWRCTLLSQETCFGETSL